MGSIKGLQVSDMLVQTVKGNACLENSTAQRVECIPSMVFVFPELSSTGTLSGTREEILLLSWLIVLMRLQEGSEVRFDWAFAWATITSEKELSFASLSMDDTIPNLQSSVRQCAANILDNITALFPSRRECMSSHASLLFTTGLLFGEGKDMGSRCLELRFQNGCLEIRPPSSIECIPLYTVTRRVETLVDTMRICISNPNISIEECIRPTSRDLDNIWSWNHDLPPCYSSCMHEMISDVALKMPEKVAISSWDGDLIYSEIEKYSTLLARSLTEMGVKLHDVLPLCFEKSRWTIVAILAAMKAGSTFVLMDPSLPLARLQNMAKQVGAKMIMTSRKQHDLGSLIVSSGRLIILDDNTFVNTPGPVTTLALPSVPASALMYLIFTSGSTGTPKGVKISHETYTSSAIPRARAVGYTASSRVLDFASYAFDVSIDSMLLTLGNGGCLCIPSDEDRVNDINDVMRRMQVTYAGLTPSVARILDSDVIASLHGLGLGGEAVSARDVAIWGQVTRIIIGYGPCECTIGCTINSSAATGKNYISIGQGNGAVMWVVNPNDHDSLVSVGAVGELLVEGPIVGQGYLDDDEKTAAAFIKDPSWLVAGHKGYSGRRSRLYKTGDLGKYDPDGSGGIVFVGRKDNQVKLHGQRVELGEIESQLKTRLPSNTNVIAEVIVPKDYGGQPMLVAFIGLHSKERQDTTDLSLVDLGNELQRALSQANAGLTEVLPRYMVPTVYIPVNHIPALISGKTDRKLLRQFGMTVDLRQLDVSTSGATTREFGDTEEHLRQAWSQTLKLNAATIRLEDNFFALGGDSLMAMRLVSLCRSQGLDLTVANTFGNPTLTAMAGVIRTFSLEPRIDALPFSMITSSVASATLEASRICGTDAASIEDIYSCTPTQESLFTFSLKSKKLYIAQRIACIPSKFSIEMWKSAWEAVVAANPILRTRLAQVQETGLQQVVLDERVIWRQSSSLEQYLNDDRSEMMGLGDGLSRYAIIDDVSDGKRYMVWTVHHVLYDGWSEPLILKEVEDALQNRSVEKKAHMKDFVRYVHNADHVSTQEFWRTELEQTGPQFPCLPSRDYFPAADKMIERQIVLDAKAGAEFTMATLIRGAWALVASQYIESDDVVFGETLIGRDITLPNVETLVGPLIATVPVRVTIDRTSTVGAYLRSVQQVISSRTLHQHMGMQNIRKVSQDAQHACEAGTGLVIQPESDYTGGDLGFQQEDAVLEALHFNPYPLMLAFGIRPGGFKVCASFDSNLIETAQMARMLAQLEMACSQLAKDPSRKIEELSCLPEAELNHIWQWNQSPPLAMDKSMGMFQADARTRQGSLYPRAVIPWVCHPRNPSFLAPIECVGDLWLEGAFLPGETVASPAWLAAGSSDCAGRSGQLHATGDMVQWQEDGSLTFVRRKENVLPIQGHTIDIADLESQFAKHLPPTIRAALAMSQSMSDGITGSTEQELLIFVEQQALGGENIEIMPASHEVMMVDLQSPQMTICATVPVSLVSVLGALSKYVEALPSYMAPFAYIVVEKLPAEGEHVDRETLKQLSSRIPRHVLIDLRKIWKEVWERSWVEVNLTAAEEVLRSAWARVLGISEARIDVQDNFFRLGGDSVLAMKLVSNLRAQGQRLTIAQVFQHMRLVDAAKKMVVDNAVKVKVESYKPFSTLGPLFTPAFLSSILPKLADPGWSVQDACLLTDSQILDVGATVKTPRTSVQYTLLYFDKSMDQERLFGACHQLVKTHDILRTIFVDHESTLVQVVVKELDIPVVKGQIVDDLEQSIKEICSVDVESDFDLGTSFVKFFHVESKNAKSCLIIRLSHAQYDGFSLPRLLRDLDTLYSGEKVNDFEPFPQYIARTRGIARNKTIEYWRNLLRDSSLSIFGGLPVQTTASSSFQSRKVDISSRLEEITPANLLTAAWALVLARRLGKTDLTFGNITSGRNIGETFVENVMGPCYQFTPVRVCLTPQWTAIDLLRSIQKQSVNSAAHGFLGFREISKECTQWSPESHFFDSVVHHQDDGDFEKMPFTGGSCRVDIRHPHGDAAHPLKAVSFVKHGQTHVGVVGSAECTMFLGEVLGELAVAIHELAVCDPECHLLDGISLSVLETIR